MDEKNRDDFDSDEESESEELYGKSTQETKGWNVFREFPIKKESGSMENTDWVDFSVKFVKVIVYILTFSIVLGSAVISKGTMLFMTSQIKKNRQIIHCNRLLGLDKQFITFLSIEERVAWLWCILGIYSVTEVGRFIRAMRICFFKSVVKPTPGQLILKMTIEGLHTIGIAMLLLIVLPELDVVKGAMLTNCFCFIPGLLNLLSRSTKEPVYTGKVMLDVLSVSAQASGFVVWPLISGNLSLWLIPVSCFLISLLWWENFVYIESDFRLIKLMARLKDSLKRARYSMALKTSPLNIMTFMVCILISLYLNGDHPMDFFVLFGESFSLRTYNASEVQVAMEEYDPSVLETVISGDVFELSNSPMTPVWVMVIQIITAYICYVVGKFTCRILIQPFSFALPLNLTVPVTINLLILFCAWRNADPCFLTDIIPDYLFFEMPPLYYLSHFIQKDVTWLWLLWLAAQMWITSHIWRPKCERLASTDKLFVLPLYSGVLVEQSLALNRVRDEEVDIKVTDLQSTEEDEIKKQSFEDYYETLSVNSDISLYKTSDVRSSDYLTRIYICATMWHETKDEMMEFLKSIFRLDEDQCARRVAQKFLCVVDPDYYELETHIFMDDAFEISDHSAEEFQVNRFARLLVDTVDEAASEVHLTRISIRPPKKYPTPYGGRLVWTLPGKTKMICHLKDKSKIRHRKRWSQVMYMYYFLGHRLMDLPISVERKEVIAENTFLLALDGDIDFQPKAVTLLIDLMKKNKNLGAACGRIHPVGSGPMVWYQMFEYAIGHWLQKATEHVIGCVLCSPGCFSLFRGKALMDDNVMRKYTLNSHEARHYVQYDQGEDRWLCTLLLQRGYRVEYSAASDAFTHCPEGFNEFFNQRRRWVPSTMANIMDLLTDAKQTIQVNDNISRLYISYQIVLMVGTILGPGTIFLMMVGAVVAAFGVGNWTSFQMNFIPLAVFMVVCLTCKTDTQLFFAGVITCFYGLVMMAVLLGIVLQIAEDGWLAPTSIFIVLTFGSFFVTAVLHPQEFHCLFYILVYYITIPSMYMLLIIFSLSNLNNVTWGTREVAQKKTLKELEKEAEAAKLQQSQKGKSSSLLGSFFGQKTDNNEKGTFEFSIAGILKVLCCTHPEEDKNAIQMIQITKTLERIEHKLDDSNPKPVDSNTRRRSSITLRGDPKLTIVHEFEESVTMSDEEDIIVHEERDDLSNPYWIEDPNLRKGEVDFLSTAEIQFWKDLIDAYLRPIEENAEEKIRIEKDLKDLRNRSVFAFTMINTIFVLVIFLLQLNQDQLHIRWPWGAKVNVSYNEDENIVVLDRGYLQLEPIGIVFVVFFAFVLIIQLFAMMFHRFSTLTHLLSTTHLNWFCSNVDETSPESLIERNAVQIVKDLQKLKTEEVEQNEQEHVGRRKTIMNLEKARQSKPNTANLDETFKKRFFNLNADEMARISVSSKRISMRRETLKALEVRRNSIIAEKRKSQMQLGMNGQRFSATGPRFSKAGPRFSSGRKSVVFRKSASGYRNASYEPAFDEDDDI